MGVIVLERDTLGTYRTNIRPTFMVSNVPSLTKRQLLLKKSFRSGSFRFLKLLIVSKKTAREEQTVFKIEWYTMPSADVCVKRRIELVISILNSTYFLHCYSLNPFRHCLTKPFIIFIIQGLGDILISSVSRSWYLLTRFYRLLSFRNHQFDRATTLDWLPASRIHKQYPQAQRETSSIIPYIMQ